MLILGIESSCDDTSVALLDCSEERCLVVSEKTASQIDIHKKFGGVIPEIAGRMHAEKIVPLIEEVLTGQPRPDVIAVTAGPGLITGLIVGVEAAKTLSAAGKIPLVRTNHINGHIHSVEIVNEASPNLKNLQPSPITQFPALCLVVSGGHTELVLMKSHSDYQILGRTKDDAAGECFDKIAKLLELPYPGGPKISQLAATGRTDAIAFPRPMLDRDNFEFSFAGLKTAALYWLEKNDTDGVIARSGATSQSQGDLLLGGSSTHGLRPRDDAKITINDFCASFEQAIVDVLVKKTLRAARVYNPKTIILAGGVSANRKLRATLEETIQAELPEVVFQRALPEYCMDNGAMIAVAGYYQALEKNFVDWRAIDVDPNWRVDGK